MVSLQDRYYGLSLISWIVIAVLFMFFLFLASKNEMIVSSQQEPQHVEPENKNVKEKFSNEKSVKVYNFNTSWCGYSVRFQPEWNKFEEEVKNNKSLSHIQAMDVKCDNESNEQMCADFEVPGYPSVVIEKDGKRIAYNGPRTSQGLIEAVNTL